MEDLFAPNTKHGFSDIIVNKYHNHKRPEKKYFKSIAYIYS